VAKSSPVLKVSARQLAARRKHKKKSNMNRFIIILIMGESEAFTGNDMMICQTMIATAQQKGNRERQQVVIVRKVD
jgi:hypothetical protein